MGVGVCQGEIVGMDQEVALLFYILLYCLSLSQQVKITFVIKCLNKGRKEVREKRKGERGGERRKRGLGEGREERRKEGRGNPPTNPFVKSLGDQQPWEAITQYVLLYLL